MSEPSTKYYSLELTDKKEKDLLKESDSKIEILDSTINSNNVSSFYNSDLEVNNPNEKIEIISDDNPYKLDLSNNKLYNRDYTIKNQAFIGSCFAFFYYKGDPIITIGPHCKN
jgi:hypothetical protein